MPNCTIRDLLCLPRNPSFPLQKCVLLQRKYLDWSSRYVSLVCVRPRYVEVLWNVSIKVRWVRAKSVSAHLEPFTAPTPALLRKWLRPLVYNEFPSGCGQTFHLEQEIVFHRELVNTVDVVSAHNGHLWEALLCVSVNFGRHFWFSLRVNPISLSYPFVLPLALVPRNRVVSARGENIPLWNETPLGYCYVIIHRR